MISQNLWLPDDERLTIMVGHSGSGKTECSVNLALAIRAQGHPAALADLDVVNPYFRSRERRDLLRQKEIRLVSTAQACVDADVPSLPPELNTLLEDRTLYSVLDIGGGSVGARVLARYRHKIAAQPHRVCFVLNAARPATGTVDGCLASLREIEQTIGLNITHIIHNTHLCDQTTPDDILEGATLARAISEQTNLPILCHCVHHSLVRKIHPDEPIFPLHLYMNKPWDEAETPSAV